MTCANENPTALTRLAGGALHLWNAPADAGLRLINLSENATFLIEAGGGYRSVLRVHREGYHSRRAIECELAWMEALASEGGVETPRATPGANGEAIQEWGDDVHGRRRMVMFEFVEGVEPDPDSDLVVPFRQLGAIAARTHVHSRKWKRPEPFERLVWDDEAVFGGAANWGDWRAAPGVDDARRRVIESAESLLRRRLAAYGRTAGRYGLIHADMRLANLLVDEGRTRLIDFDDCGLGWFMYDFAAGISFMEHHPQVPELRRSWLDGYRGVRALDKADEDEIDSFVMLRRMALLAWIGSHGGTDLARAQAPHFAEGTALMAERYLGDFG